MASRRKSNENKKSIVKQEPIPDINMEDSPPVSDSDVCINHLGCHLPSNQNLVLKCCCRGRDYKH